MVQTQDPLTWDLYFNNIDNVDNGHVGHAVYQIQAPESSGSEFKSFKYFPWFKTQNSRRRVILNPITFIYNNLLYIESPAPDPRESGEEDFNNFLCISIVQNTLAWGHFVALGPSFEQT